ncbi:hypothetical protein ACHWQZ_G011658 [Mnemiopsis leidyi]
MSKDDGGLGALKAGLASFSRLFDHRAVIQGEARYFIEEFQNKRKGTEKLKLEECQQILEKHCGETLPAAAETADTNIAKLDKKVLELTELCDLILPDSIDVPMETDTAYSRPPSPGHDPDWDEFMSSIEEEKRLIDRLFDNDIEQFRIYLEKHGPG